MRYAVWFFAYIMGAMVRPLSLAQHTLFADLLEQGSADLFDPEFPENGSILVRPGRAGANVPFGQVYYQGYRPASGGANKGQRFATYLGRADDPTVATRIARFHQVKAVRAERSVTVRALIGAGMPHPNRITGRIIEALARKGLFHDDAVLLGNAACQTYTGILGVRLSKPTCPVADQPLVAFAARNDDQLRPVLAALRTIDPTFAAEPGTAATYRSASGVQVAATVTGRADDEMPNLTGFLIARAVRTVVLYGPGIPVIVPAPERYVAHAQIRQTQPHDAWVAELTEGLALAGRDHALAEALEEAVASASWLLLPSARTQGAGR